AISSPVVLAAPIVLPSPMVGNAIDCDCFRRGSSGRADGLNGEAIASETEVFLAAPIGGAGRELMGLARTANKNLIDAPAPRSCSRDHHGLLFRDKRLPRRHFDLDLRSPAIRGTEHRRSVKRAGQVRR